MARKCTKISNTLAELLFCSSCFLFGDVLIAAAIVVCLIFLMITLLCWLGEDRWLCTLMVQSGWRLEYSAAAEDSTFCPDNFDEFFKQRRRWIPSTLANLVLLISEWKLTVNNNDYISFPFILYQALMVFATIIRFVEMFGL